MCLFPQENQQPVLGGHRFFRRKVTIFIGRETKTHISPTKINEQKFAEVSSSCINYSFRKVGHSTTTTNNTSFGPCETFVFDLRHHVDDARASVRTCDGGHAQCCTRNGSRSKAAASLRQFLRHERLTVAMLLAERDHHTAPRRQKQARSGEEVRVRQPISGTTSSPTGALRAVFRRRARVFPATMSG